MGLLDEAIQEHLELKRRRGADPTEIERLEREALGPVRRIQGESAAPEAPDMVDEAPDVAGDAGYHGLAADQGDADFGHDDEFADGLEGTHDYYEGDEPELAEDPQELAPERAEVHGVVPPAEPPPPEPLPAVEESEPRASDRPVYEDPGVETAEYDVEAEHEAERAGEQPGDEDVLEETPEFLQDAPEHDRLWFEQRPPKDFDFDG